jgi:transposase
MSSFCVKLGNSATTTLGKLQQAFGDYTVSRAQASRWQNKYSEGRNLVKDEQRSSRPSAIRTGEGDNIARVIEFFDQIY